MLFRSKDLPRHALGERSSCANRIDLDRARRLILGGSPLVSELRTQQQETARQTKPMNTPTLPAKINQFIRTSYVPRRCWRGMLIVAAATGIAAVAFATSARAVCQDACLTNQNTVLGDDALLNNTGTDNTAIGFNALLSNTSGSFNTSTG